MSWVQGSQEGTTTQSTSQVEPSRVHCSCLLSGFCGVSGAFWGLMVLKVAILEFFIRVRFFFFFQNCFSFFFSFF